MPIAVEYASLAVLLAGLTAWMLGVAGKTGALEWAQMHAPCDLIYKMLTCRFCTTFWTGMLLALAFFVVLGFRPELLALPFFSTQFAKNLW